MISVRLMNTVRGKRKEETKRMTSPPHVSCYIWCIVITLLTIFGSDQSDANLIERFAQHSSRRFLAGESAASHASYYIPYGLRSLPGDGQRTYTYMALPSDRIFDFVATRYHDRAALSKVKGPMALPGFLAKFDWWISKDKKMRKGAGFMKTTDPTYVLLSAPSLATLLHDLLQHHNVPVDSESVRTLVVGGSDRRSSVYGELVVKELAPWFSKILWEAKDTPIHLYSTPVLTLPIGLTEYYFRPYVKEASAAIAQADVNKKPKLILAAWGAVWNGPKIRALRSRKRGAQFARENDFVDNRVASHRSGNAATIPKNEYWQTLMQYKFLLYPAGLGIQSPKFTEALLCKAICISERSSAVEDLARYGFPIVVVDSFLEITEEKLHTWWGELKDKIDIAYKFYLTDNYFQEVVVRRGGISFDRAVGLPFEQNEIDAQLQAPPGDHGSHRIGTGAEQYNGNHHENESNSTEDTLGALGMLPASTTAAQTTAEKPGRAVSFAKTIEKTHFSTLENGNRFVFVAGLEGVGHHSMSFLFNKCRRDRVCSASSELSKLVYNNCHKPRGVIQTQGYDIGDPKKAQRAFVRSLQRLESKRKMSTPALNAGRGRLFFLNTHNSRGLSTGTSGMMSYPNCPPWELYPDIVIMAKLMEEAGVDFRVLVLHRPSHSIMRSTITNRSHRKPGEEERVLAHGAAVLYTMLSGLDSKFFRVVEYHELNQRDTWEGAGGLKEFLLGRKGSYPDFAMQLTSERVDKAKRERDHPYFTPGFFPAEDEHLWGASERLAFFNDKLLTLKE